MCFQQAATIAAMTVVLEIGNRLSYSPLTFLRPDVLAHVHGLWIKRRHQVKTVRAFSAIFDPNELRPFAAVGLQHVFDFVQNWKFADEDIEFLQLLPSCAAFQSGFWNYLRTLTFRGDINGVRGGEVFGTRPIQLTEMVAKQYGNKIPLPLLDIEGEAGIVALMSEFIFNILAQATLSSMAAFAHKDRTLGVHNYGGSELYVHPIYAVLESEADAISNNRPISLFDQAPQRIFIRWPHALKDEYVSAVEEIRDKVRTKLNLDPFIVYVV